MEQIFVGLDVHKKTIQMSVMDKDGEELLNKSIPNTPNSISEAFGGFPEKTRMVIESSSVWKAPFFQLRDSMGFDVVLSNPYTTKLIAKSKKKTDKIDARILADLDRGNYIIESHVPSKKSMDNRDLTRFRRTLSLSRASYKNSIHGILLQKSIQSKHRPFTQPWLEQVRALGDYRIDSYLNMISHATDNMLKADSRIRAAVKDDEYAQLLKTIPGIGDYFALVISSGIDDIDRFLNSKSLCAYAGIVPAVRASADKVAYGHITHQGSDIMRWALVQATLIHVRCCKKSDLGKFYNRIQKKRGFSIAIVAAGSKMLRMIYWILKERRKFVLNYSQDVSCVDHVGGEPRLCNCGHS